MQPAKGTSERLGTSSVRPAMAVIMYLTLLLPTAAAVVVASPRPTTQPRSHCPWANDTGQRGGDIDTAKFVLSKEECFALCWASSLCLYHAMVDDIE